MPQVHRFHLCADQSSRLLPQVCTVFAESLLQSKPKWQQEEFMDAWLNSVPQVTACLTGCPTPAHNVLFCQLA